MDSIKLAKIVAQKKEDWINSTQPLAYTLALDLKGQIENLIATQKNEANENTESEENIDAATQLVENLHIVLNNWKTNITRGLEVTYESVKAARTYEIAHVFSTSLDRITQFKATKQLREELAHTLKTHKNKMMFHDNSLFEHIILLINDVLDKLGIKQRLNATTSIFGADDNLKKGIHSLEGSLQGKESVYEEKSETHFKRF